MLRRRFFQRESRAESGGKGEQFGATANTKSTNPPVARIVCTGRRGVEIEVACRRVAEQWISRNVALRSVNCAVLRSCCWKGRDSLIRQLVPSRALSELRCIVSTISTGCRRLGFRHRWHVPCGSSYTETDRSRCELAFYHFRRGQKEQGYGEVG